MLLCSVVQVSLKTLRAFTTSALAAIDSTQSIVDSTTSSKTSRSPSTENQSQSPETMEKTWSTKSLTIDDFSPFSLNPTHDQEDESNRQKAILIARFHDSLVLQGLPKTIIDDLVRMRFETMLMEMGEFVTELDFSDFSDDD